jgi:hypothetical protein
LTITNSCSSTVRGAKKSVTSACEGGAHIGTAIIMRIDSVTFDLIDGVSQQYLLLLHSVPGRRTIFAC